MDYHKICCFITMNLKELLGLKITNIGILTLVGGISIKMVIRVLERNSLEAQPFW